VKTVYRCKIIINQTKNWIQFVSEKKFFPILFQKNQNIIKNFKKSNFTKRQVIFYEKIKEFDIFLKSKKLCTNFGFKLRFFEIIKILIPRSLNFLGRDICNQSLDLDIIYNFNNFFWCKCSINIPFRGFKLRLWSIEYSKKINDLYIFLKTTNFFFVNLKNFYSNNKLIFRFLWFEVLTIKYGKDLYHGDLRHHNILNISKNSRINFIFSWIIRSHTVSPNFSLKFKIQNSPKSFIIYKNNFLLVHIFIHHATIKVHKRSIELMKTKKRLTNIGMILKTYQIKGLIGKNYIAFLYFALISNRWDFHDKKVFWKYWIFCEIFNPNKNLKCTMFRIRLNFFFLNRFNLFKQPFF
jgi:hypothetical protein